MQRLKSLQLQGKLTEVDVQLARFLSRIHPALSASASLAIALTSWALSQGHTCLPLSEIGLLAAATDDGEEQWPGPEQLRQELLVSGAVGDVKNEDQTPKPLMLDSDNRLFLLHSLRAEQAIATDLLRRATAKHDWPEAESARARNLLRLLFPQASRAGLPNLQQCAASLALRNKLLILCGGPGTGKTYTLARILALFSALATNPTRMALAAPTGRAAMRLGEAIHQVSSTLPPELRPQATFKPQTLHRLLGFQPQSGTFLHSAANPLHLDLLVIDEASMVDTALLEALLAALSDSCRLILCGDPGQLPPVEAGNILADLAAIPSAPCLAALPGRTACLQELCGTDCPGGTMDNSAASTNPLNDCRITLQQVHRFGGESGMMSLARALQEDGADAFIQTFAQPWPDISLYEPEQANTVLTALLQEQLDALTRAHSAQEAFAVFEQFRILCALREGPWGVAGINARCLEMVRAQAQGQRRKHTHTRQDHYQGLPILILRNDHGQRLYNGDIGIIWQDEHQNLKAWFADVDGLRPLAPAALPPWQPAYAMTVHKAQGAEFAKVLLLIPPEDNQVLSRELLYTAITRAKKELILCGKRELLCRIAARRLIRYSGLGSMLQDAV
ncbi:MAG: exodeoxyribonuclease V subunit alpha [Desulfobulbaceae bacterium]|nr:exodeoxyribonuclease V subunit alpha [Desulfobulbaceae bacterium]